MRKLLLCLLLVSLVVAAVQAPAVAANNTTVPGNGTAAKPTATPTATPKPANASAPAAPAVKTTGAVNGTVYDSLGNLVPDADVYLKDGSGTVMGLTATDGNGSYSYTELKPGNYSIIVQTGGYMWIANLAVMVGNTTVANVRIPDYVHLPAVTPRPTPAPAVNNTTSAPPKGGAVKVTGTPAPTVKSNATANASRPAGNATQVTAGNNSTAGDTSDAGSGDIFGGIIGFFKSLFGL